MTKKKGTPLSRLRERQKEKDSIKKQVADMVKHVRGPGHRSKKIRVL